MRSSTRRTASSACRCSWAARPDRRSSNVVTVHYETADRTATAGVDYRPVSGTLSFAAGQTVKTVVVPIIDNGPKPSRNFVLTLSNPTGGASIADGTGTIVIGASAADPVATPGISAPPDVVVGEADGYVDLAVRLSAPGQSPVSVSLEHELQRRELRNHVRRRARARSTS